MKIGFKLIAEAFSPQEVVRQAVRAEEYRSLLDRRLLPTFGSVPLWSITPPMVPGPVVRGGGDWSGCV